MRPQRSFLLLLFVCALGAPAAALAQEEVPPPGVQERVLATLPHAETDAARYANPNSPRVFVDTAQRRLAYVVKQGAKEHVVVDGARQPDYDAVELVTTATQQARRFFFSPNGKRYAYVGRRDGAYYLVVDGKEIARLDEPRQPFFGPNGRLVYQIQQRQRWPKAEGGYRDSARMVIEGIRGTSRPYMACCDPVFSPDGRHVVYFAWDWTDKLRLVMDGREVRASSGDGYPIAEFSPDGQTFAYFLKRGDAMLLVVNGRELKVDRPDYSPQRPDDIHLLLTDNGHFAYVSSADAGESEEFRVVVDGKPGRSYPSLGGLNMSADGRHVAYLAWRDENYHVVVDGVEGPAYEHATGVRLSPDGNHVAYFASHSGNDMFSVIDGVPGKTYWFIDSHGATFSPDGRRCCFFATKADDTQVLVVTGEPPQEYPAQGNYFDQDAAFSPDGKHVAYRDMRSWTHYVIGLDGHPVGRYDGLADGASLAFDNAGRFHTVAIRGDTVLRVEVQPDQLSPVAPNSPPEPPPSNSPG